MIADTAGLQARSASHLNRCRTLYTFGPMKYVVSGWIYVLLAAVSLGDVDKPAPYLKSIETARAERLQRLTKPDGWLTL
ncbi:MAG: hypothetical protein ABIZ04_14485, partial [Opitutus sp.]